MTVHDHENFERQNSLEEGIAIPIALQFFKFHGQTLPQHLDIASQGVLIDPSQTLNSENSRLSRKRGGGGSKQIQIPKTESRPRHGVVSGVAESSPNARISAKSDWDQFRFW